VPSTASEANRAAPQPPARGEVAQSATGTPSGPGSVLKSGVIEGMAYRLYTDGSIEAELPAGTVHFASIEQLREYLEREGG
jgi:hypothetical protein